MDDLEGDDPRFQMIVNQRQREALGRAVKAGEDIPDYAWTPIPADVSDDVWDELRGFVRPGAEAHARDLLARESTNMAEPTNQRETTTRVTDIREAVARTAAANEATVRAAEEREAAERDGLLQQIAGAEARYKAKLEESRRRYPRTWRLIDKQYPDSDMKPGAPPGTSSHISFGRAMVADRKLLKAYLHDSGIRHSFVYKIRYRLAYWREHL